MGRHNRTILSAGGGGVTPPILTVTGTLDFGDVWTNDPEYIDYTITNTGDETATISSVVSNNALFVVSNAPATVVGLGGTATFRVTFSPIAASTPTATITVSSSTIGASITQLGTISGTGKQVYYSRPAAGGPYGTGTGLSSANAWSGLSAGNQATVVAAGGRLAFVGTHIATYTFVENNLVVIGNDPAGAGIIDGQSTRATGIDINALTGIEIISLTVYNHTTQNVYLRGDNWTFISRSCNFSNSGNQGVQHIGAGGVATHYDATVNGCSDEAISLHDTATVTLYRGQFRNNTNAFANFVNGAVLNIYDVWDTSNNGASGKVDLDVGTTVSWPANAVCNVYRSRINGFVITQWGEINFYDSYVKRSPVIDGVGATSDNVVGTLRLRRCILDGTGATAPAFGIIDMQSTSRFLAAYTTFINVPAGLYGVVLRSGMTLEGLSNCNFVGVGNIGRAIRRTASFSASNCIMRGLERVDDAAGMTYTNCSFTDNTIGPSGSQVGSVNSDPLFVDVSTLNFATQVGSPMRNAGTSVSESTGIFSANWGNSTTAPVVVTKTQNTPPDIGAYIS